MFRGLVLILVLAATEAHAQGIRHDSRGDPAARQTHSKPKPDIQPSDLIAIKSEIDRIGTALEAANNKANSAEEKDRAQRDLAAQEKVANWAPAVFWVALVELIVTAVGVVLIYLTIRETRRIGQAQVRAYVSVPQCNIEFYDLGVGAQPSVQPTFRNSGNSHARDFRWNVTLQYVYGKRKRTRSLVPLDDLRKWATTQDIAPSDPIAQGAILPEMMLEPFASKNEHFSAGVRLRISFVFLDAFDQQIWNEAYFLGHAEKGSDTPSLFRSQWLAVVSPSAKPSDWDGPDQE